MASRDRQIKTIKPVFVFVWSARSNASRCHVVKSTEMGLGGPIVETYCREKLDSYEVDRAPHPKFAMCDTCNEVRK